MKQLANTIWVVLGTRPEAIKQAPVYLELCRMYGADAVSLIGTGQHQELLDQALAPFGLKLDLNLAVMGRSNGLSELSATILQEMGMYIQKYTPSCLIVQGDTSTAAMSGLAAFFQKIPVYHNEAGLRSYDNDNPFPEEINRKILTSVATLHLAPTELSYQALLKEGVPADKIYLTGNTGIDAMMMALKKIPSMPTLNLLRKIEESRLKPVFMTAHRRENAGQSMNDWMDSVASYFTNHPELALVFPLHPNNLARAVAEEKLGKLSNCHLIAPLDYVDCCHVVNDCHFVVTDSGGIQEEAATLGIPVVVCRKTTERMEAVHAEIAVLAGLESAQILAAMDWANHKANSEARAIRHIFGNGTASERIAKIIYSETSHTALGRVILAGPPQIKAAGVKTLNGTTNLNYSGVSHA